MSKLIATFREDGNLLVLENERLSLSLSRNPEIQKEMARLRLAPGGQTFSLWTGFAGITGHVSDFFFVTEPSPEVSFLEIERKKSTVSFRIEGMKCASWEVTWDVTLTPDALRMEALVLVPRTTRTDAEVDLFAFEAPEGQQAENMTLDSGYIFPPRDWFATVPPEISYGGNDGLLSVLNHRPHFRFAGDGHDRMDLYYGEKDVLQLACPGNNYFFFVPSVPEREGAPEKPERLRKMKYRFRSFERFGLGTSFRTERRTYEKWERLQGTLEICLTEGSVPRSLSIVTKDPEFDATVARYHRTHAHCCIGHRGGFSGGWHNAGREGFQSVSFEYFMHCKAHLYSVHPVVDDLFAHSIEAVYRTDTRPDGMIWASPLGGRGEFYESNASMLIMLCDYVRRTGDLRHIEIGRKWMDYLLRNTPEDPFLYRTPSSTGIAREGGGSFISNWWDVVAMGGYDAFINVLYYPALVDFAKVERLAGCSKRADELEAAAEKLKESFNRLFWNEKEGRYVGWVDTEGGVHDSWYTFVNTTAIYYGMADAERSEAILRSLDAKMEEIGYTGFSLPCNLTPIPWEEYNAGDYWSREFGYPHYYDPFGVYENGGIWIWTSAYYIGAWRLFDPDHAYEHFLKIIEQYRKDNLQGAGNGYFWDPETGEMLEGSKQEPLLCNTVMSIWGLYTLFGIEMDILEGLKVSPRLPKALAGSEVTVRYLGMLLHFRFLGHGSIVKSIAVNGQTADPMSSIPKEFLADGAEIVVEVG